MAARVHSAQTIKRGLGRSVPAPGPREPEPPKPGKVVIMVVASSDIEAMSGEIGDGMASEMKTAGDGDMSG